MQTTGAEGGRARREKQQDVRTAPALKAERMASGRSRERASKRCGDLTDGRDVRHIRLPDPKALLPVTDLHQRAGAMSPVRFRMCRIIRERYKVITVDKFRRGMPPQARWTYRPGPSVCKNENALISKIKEPRTLPLCRSFVPSG